MAEGLDYAWHPAITADRAKQIKRAGKDFVMRYLSHDSSKNLSDSERKALHAAGIDVGLNWESTAGRPNSGRSGGLADAREAKRQADALGAPKDVAIYFSFDVDDTVGPLVTGYYKAVAEVIGLNRTGAYGSERVIRALFDHKLITYGWQTYAWSGGRRDPRAHVYQYHNNVTVAGISADLNRTYHDAGLWRASGGSKPAPDSADDLSVLTPGERAAVEGHRKAAEKYQRAVAQKNKGRMAYWRGQLALHYTSISALMARIRALHGGKAPPRNAPRHRWERNEILKAERANDGSAPKPPKPKPSGRDIAKEHPELKPDVRRVVQRIVDQFPNLKITSTTGGQHAPNSYHPQGRAGDLAYIYSGDPSDENRRMDEVGAWVAENLTGELTEGIHNPTLSVKNGRTQPSSFWGPSTWAAHRNHIHVAV